MVKKIYTYFLKENRFIGLYVFILISFFQINNIDAQQNLIKIDSIVIEGNKVTKRKIILKELDFHEKEEISLPDFEKSIEQSKINLLNTGLFNFVNISYTTNNKKAKVTINLTEQWYIWPIPFIEHADRNFSSFLHNADWSRINYGLFVEIDNFRGRKEQLKFKIRGGYKEQYGFMYSKPNLDKEQKHGITFESSYFRQHEVAYATGNNILHYYRNDNEFTQTNIRSTFKYQYRQTLYDFHDIGIQYQNQSILDTVAKLNPDYFGFGQNNLQYLNISYSYTNEHRNYIFYPTKGYVFNLAYLRRIFFNSKNKDINMFSAQFRKYFSLNSRISTGHSLYAKISDNVFQPYALIEGFGYSHYLRAYEYYVIDGYNSILFKNNFRYNILKRKDFKVPVVPWSQFNKSYLSIYINAFAEAGYVENSLKYDMSNTMVNEFLYSAGIGIDFVTYYETVVRFEYSINHLGESGFFIHMGSGI